MAYPNCWHCEKKLPPKADRVLTNFWSPWGRSCGVVSGWKAIRAWFCRPCWEDCIEHCQICGNELDAEYVGCSATEEIQGCPNNLCLGQSEFTNQLLYFNEHYTMDGYFETNAP